MRNSVCHIRLNGESSEYSEMAVIFKIVSNEQGSLRSEFRAEHAGELETAAVKTARHSSFKFKDS